MTTPAADATASRGRGRGLSDACASVVRTLRTDRALAVVVTATIVGLVLRVVSAAIAARAPKGLFDPARYAGYARVIADGQGMVEPLTGQPTAYYPPGYPWFLGIIQWGIDHTPLPDDLALVTALVQAVLGAASVALIGTLGRRIHSPAAGAVAAVVVALMPNLVLHSSTVLGETLTIALLLAFLVALVPPPGHRPWPAGMGRRRLATAGVLLGLVLLVRPVTAGVLVAVAVCWWISGIGWRRTATWTGVLLGIAVLCIVPWTVRNAIRMDALVPLSTNSGDNLCIGHGPSATGSFRLDEDCAIQGNVVDGTAVEVSSDREKTDLALSRWRRGWRDEPGLTVNRLRFTVERDDDALRALQSYGLDPWLDDGAETVLSRASNGAWFVVGLVGLVGLVKLSWTGEGQRLLVPLTVLSVLAAPLLTFGDPRFKVPVVPLMALAAAVAVTRRSVLRPPPSVEGDQGATPRT
ncbi:MAG: hypothetical protein ACR2JF_14375 [Iamia sp.]